MLYKVWLKTSICALINFPFSFTLIFMLHPAFYSTLFLGITDFVWIHDLKSRALSA